jgi:hypothetical protein
MVHVGSFPATANGRQLENQFRCADWCVVCCVVCHSSITMTTIVDQPLEVAIIGGGPAGLVSLLRHYWNMEWNMWHYSSKKQIVSVVFGIRLLPLRLVPIFHHMPVRSKPPSQHRHNQSMKNFCQPTSQRLVFVLGVSISFSSGVFPECGYRAAVLSRILSKLPAYQPHSCECKSCHVFQRWRWW